MPSLIHLRKFGIIGANFCPLKHSILPIIYSRTSYGIKFYSDKSSDIPHSTDNIESTKSNNDDNEKIQNENNRSFVYIPPKGSLGLFPSKKSIKEKVQWVYFLSKEIGSGVMDGIKQLIVDRKKAKDVSNAPSSDWIYSHYRFKYTSQRNKTLLFFALQSLPGSLILIFPAIFFFPHIIPIYFLTPTILEHIEPVEYKAKINQSSIVFDIIKSYKSVLDDKTNAVIQEIFELAKEGEFDIEKFVEIEDDLVRILNPVDFSGDLLNSMLAIVGYQPLPIMDSLNLNMFKKYWNQLRYDDKNLLNTNLEELSTEELNYICKCRGIPYVGNINDSEKIIMILNWLKLVLKDTGPAPFIFYSSILTKIKYDSKAASYEKTAEEIMNEEKNRYDEANLEMSQFINSDARGNQNDK